MPEGRSSSNLPPVVLLGGEANALSVARSLSRVGAAVHLICSEDTCARHSRHCRWIPIEKGNAEAAYAEILLDQHSAAPAGAVVLACDDAGIKALLNHRSALIDRGYRLDECNPTAQSALLDKLSTYHAAMAAGVETPRFWRVDSMDRVVALRDELVFPLLLKPRLAHRAGRGFDRKHLVVDDFDGLLAALAAEAAAGVDVLLMECIPGPDSELCSYYTYIDERGDCLFDFTKRVIRRYPEGMGLGCFHITDWIPEIVEPARRLFRHAGLRGVANVEFKRDPRDGRHKLIECNARFTAANCLVASSGIDIAQFVYRRIAGLPQPALPAFRRGLRLWDPAIDAMAMLERRRSGDLTLAGWAATVARRQTFPYFRWTDPAPALARAKKMWKAAKKRRDPDTSDQSSAPRATSAAPAGV